MSTEVILTAVGLVVMFAVAAGVFKYLLVRYETRALVSAIKATPDFTPDKLSIGFDRASALAIDENRAKVCLVRRAPASAKIVSYADILGVEVVEDGLSLTKTVRPSQVPNSLVTAFLFGAGARVRDRSRRPSAEASGKVKKIDLRLLISDPAAPLHEINFYSGIAADAGNALVYQGRLTVRNWYATFAVLIMPSALPVKVSPVSTPRAPLSIVDSVDVELHQLARLQSPGVAAQP
jgi:hypothetical protein